MMRVRWTRDQAVSAGLGPAIFGLLSSWSYHYDIMMCYIVAVAWQNAGHP